MEHYHPNESLAAFALGCLDAEEGAEVGAHLGDCAVCREEVQALKETCSLLLHAVPAATPPEHLRGRLLARLPRRRSYAWFESLLVRWPRLVPAGSLAAVALTIIFGTAHLLRPQMEGTSGVPLAAVQVVTLQPTSVIPAARGTLLVDREHGSGLLVVESLSSLDRSLQYQLWLIKDGQRTSGGTFSAAADGSARLEIHPPQPLAFYDAFGITIEPFGGSVGPTGDKVLGGRMVM